MTDIKVSLHSFRPHDEIKRGRLQLLCNGEDCNEQFINAIGRIAVKRIPTYAFAKDLIKMERINPETGYHDSIPFNHDMMRDRLKNTPVMHVDPGFSFLHERFWQGVDYLSEDREVHEDEKRIEAFIDVKNTASEDDIDEVLHVTTNDMQIYVDNELKKLYSDEYPLLLISLRPKEAFKCSLRAVLGIGVTDTCWDACSNFCFDEETIPNKRIVSFQAASHFDEFVLVERALEYFRIRTNALKDEIHRMYLLEKNPTERFQIILKDEDHTMGESINYEFQSHPDIRKSSNAKHDHLVREVMIDVSAFEKSKLLNAVMESMDILVKKIEKFEKEFNKIDRPKGVIKNSESSKKGKSKGAKQKRSTVGKRVKRRSK